jgi:hypothetical protein
MFIIIGNNNQKNRKEATKKNRILEPIKQPSKWTHQVFSSTNLVANVSANQATHPSLICVTMALCYRKISEALVRLQWFHLAL